MTANTKTAQLTGNGSATLSIGRNNRPIGIYVTGTFGGGTVKLYVTADGVTYLPVQKDGADLALTSAGYVVMEIPTNGVKVELTSATSPSIDIKAV